MNHRAWTCLVASLLLASVVGAVPGAAATAPPDVTDVEYTGDGNVRDGTESLTMWRSEPQQFEVTVSGDDDYGDTEACLVVRPADTGGTQELACQPVDAPANETATVTLDVSEWPEDLTGEQQLDFEFRSSTDSRVLASATYDASVIEKGGDLDDDGLTNEREVELGTNLRVADTDNDSLSDGMEVETYGTNPTSADTDGDGLDDGAEVDEHDTDPTEADTDGDGLPDARELELGTNPSDADSDGDGLDDGAEVNTYQTDPTDPDTDDDGLDDGAEVNEHDTDPTEEDTDGDGLTDSLEVNTYGTDPNKVDTDGDGLNDGAEVDEHDTDPSEADSDGDGLDDGAEVNRYGTNPNEADTDDDGLDDGAEVDEYDTDPTDPDTDDDGQNDAAEVQAEQSRALSPWMLPVVGAVAVAVTCAVLAYRIDGVSMAALRRRLPTGDRSQTDSGEAADAVVETDGSREDNYAAGDGATASQSASEDVPVEFLSAEERVMKLLDDNDGRMQQSAIVEQTEWSKAKTSRVLSEMEDDGDVVKIKLGRGNVVSRPDDLPPGVDPPSDDAEAASDK